MPSVKHRIILGIGETKIDRPRQLQQAAGTDEHHVVHVLYLLNREGFVNYKKHRARDAPGINLYDITLTPKGLALYKELT